MSILKFDSLIPLALIFTLSVLLFPLPPWFLDFCLALNIVVAFVILFVSIYIARPVDFSVYPALLLITTVMRLALNVATTRKILLEGHQGLDVAGKLIQSFGQFLIQGNFAVGLVIFLIIRLINLKVITKGAGRIAEVAARFTLDALPGKQMSIDSDLSAGLISEEEAKARRKELAREAEFYGAMDGAAKFVSGEALTGIFIMILNIVGGFSIAYFQYGMELKAAASTFTVLTIGDGLLSQIPAIIVSISAGIIVSRAASGDFLSIELVNQIGKSDVPLIFSSLAALALGLLPGLPLLPFLFVSLLPLIFLYLRKQILAQARAQQAETSKSEKTGTQKQATTEELLESIEVNPIVVEMGLGLFFAIGESKIPEKLKKVRLQLATKYGFICPTIKIINPPKNKSSDIETLRIFIKEALVFEAKIHTRKLLAVKTNLTTGPIEGDPVIEPVFGLPGFWIDESLKMEAEAKKYHVVNASNIFATCMLEVISLHMHEILRRQEVYLLVEKVQKEFPKLVEDVMPTHLSLAQIHQILNQLLKERISIKDLKTIFEILGEAVHTTKNVEKLGEIVRSRLAKGALRSIFESETTLHVIALERPLENTLLKSITEKEDGLTLALHPRVSTYLYSQIDSLNAECSEKGQNLVFMVAQDLRLPFAKWVLRLFKRAVVISNNDIPYKANLKIMSLLKLPETGEQIEELNTESLNYAI